MRLTEKKDSGHWCLRDVPWSDLKPGVVLTEKVWEKLYGVLWKLKDYEDTGLMPDEIGKLNTETQEEARKMLEKVAELSEEIEKAQEKTRWIPVTERLPESGSMVLVSLEGISIPDIAECGGTSQEGIKFRPVDNDFAYAKGIVAWMPLPEPYRAEVEEKPVAGTGWKDHYRGRFEKVE